MAKADQRERDHVPKQPGVDPSLLADMEEPATAKIRTLLQQGVANAGMFAKIVHENPQAKGEIVALLNNALGNGFTTRVVEISENEDSPRQGKPPVMSQAAREELADGAYSSDGTTGRKPKDAATAQPPSATHRAEAMELFREVNGGPDKGGEEKRAEEEPGPQEQDRAKADGEAKRAEEEQARPQEQELAKAGDQGEEKRAEEEPGPQEQDLARTDDQGEEKRAEEEQPRPQEQDVARTDDQGEEKREEEQQPRPQEQELAKVDDQQDERRAEDEQERRKRHRPRPS